MSIYFRQATMEDLDRVLVIEDKSFYQGIKESPQVFAERITIFPQGFFLLEIDDCNEPVGYICSELWPGKNNLPYQNLVLGHSIKGVHHCQGQELYISSMGVLPEYRGKGFGLLLLNELIKQISTGFPQVSNVLLIVSEKWLAARKTYKKLGFAEVTVLPSFFEPVGLQSEQGIVMRKKIKREVPCLD